MNKIKKFLLYCISGLLAFSFLISPFPKPNQKVGSSVDIIESEIIDDNVLSYVTISTNGKTLTTNEIKTIDSDNDGRNDSSFIFANGTITLNLKPLQYNYKLTLDESYYYKETETVSLEKDTETGNFPLSFKFKGEDYSYTISSQDILNITSSQTPNPIGESDLIKMTDTETTRTFAITTGYTLKADAPNTSFKFIASTSNTKESNQQYALNFERPVLDFRTDDVTMFTCVGLDVGSTPFVNEKIERELSYENVKLQFTNNNYTENNPLYFDINHNGFVYTFKLYSKEISSNQYLFVEYYDEQKPVNNTSIATKINSNTGNIDIPVYKFEGETTNFNMFSIDFKKTGRYEISVYDETYNLGLKNNNYYSTSFYIKNNESSAFDNAYAIMQSYDDENNFLDYIVSESTQNTNVEITIKNLSYYFENDEAIKNFEPTETLSDLNVIEFIKTTLSGSLNIPESTFYSVSDLKKILEKNQNFSIDCTEDAFYEIVIYQFDETDYSIKAKHSYQFTIVKQPKISFTVYNVNEDNDPIYDPVTNRPKTIIHEADTPYTTVPEKYKININSDMEISTFFSSSATSTTTHLEKTYLNEYTINYAMQAVKIDKVNVTVDGKNVEALGLQFFGVGEIVAEITVNSATTTFTIKSGETLSFTEYGTYSVRITDSMGTVGIGVFKYEKPVSVSAIILISLVGIIALSVVLFIISSRGKVKTR